MKTPFLRSLFHAMAAGAVVLFCTNAAADAFGTSHLGFGNLQITPASGSLRLLTNWHVTAFAQADGSSQFAEATGGSVAADASAAWSEGHGSAGAGIPPSLDPIGLARTTAHIPGTIIDYAESTGRGSAANAFMITGGQGNVGVDYSIFLEGDLLVQTDPYGLFADTRTIFVLGQDGSPLLKFDALLHIGPDAHAHLPVSKLLTSHLTLNYDTPYFLYLETDSETRVANIPEPSGLACSAVVAGCAGLAGLICYLRRQRSGPTTAAPQTEYPPQSFCFSLVLLGLLLAPGLSQATPKGANWPGCIPCAKHNGPANFVPTLSQLSLTEGNLVQDYTAATVRNASGVTLDFTATYNSYDADGSRTHLNTVMGYGWTHSYNVFLFHQREHLFRYDGDGRITKFQLGPGGTYSVLPGFFEWLVRNSDGSYTITDKAGTAWHFAAILDTPFLVDGPVYRLTSIVDRNANTTTLNYLTGNLVSVTDPWGRSLTFTYDSQHRLASVTDPRSNTTRFTYDAAGQHLVSITDPASKAITYSYNFMHQLTGKVDKDGRAYTYLYQNLLPVGVQDSQGQVMFSLSNSRNWAVNETNLAFDLVRNMVSGTTTKTDGRGNRWTYDYNAQGYLTRIVAPDLCTSTYNYDAATLQLTWETDPLGRTNRYFYDALGNRIMTIDSLGNTNRYTYEPVFNQMTSMTDPNGRTTTWQYDSRGNRTNETGPAPFNYTRSWTYDSHGWLLTETDKNGNVTKHAYDAVGNRTNITDALHHATSFTYDAAGNLLSRTDANGHSTANAYDALNRLTSETTGLSGVSPTPLHQANLRLEVQPLADGTLKFQWDQPGTVLTRATTLSGPFEDVCAGDLPVMASPHLVTGPHTNTAEFYRLRADPVALAALGYALPGTNPAATGVGEPPGFGGPHQPKASPGGDTTTYAYDNEGHRTAVTNCNGAVTRYEYDLRKRLVKTTDALGYTVGYAYDNNDNRIAVTNQNGFVTRFEYDAQNRLTRTIDALNCASSRSYDCVGNVLTDTDANGHTTTYAYDALNRRMASINALGGVTQYEYANPSGGTPCCSPTYGSSLVTKQTDANGKVTYFKYEALDRLTQTIRKQGDTADVIDSDDAVTAYTYDPNGNRLTVATRISATDWLTNWFGYDALNRPIASTNGAGDFSLTAYDPVGNVRVVQAPNLNLTTNTYDAHDHLIQVDDRIGRVASYTYDCMGNRLSATDGNTNTTAYAYDALNRLITTTDAMLQPTRYFYDPVGNLTNLVDRMTRATRYAYDPLNRRTNSVDAIGCVTAYAYDCVGNLQAITDARGNTTSYEYDALNRLVKEIYPDLPQPSEPPDSNKRFFTYDGVGNLTGRLDQKSSRTVYAYSDLYFLTNRSYVSDPSDRFTYDFAGRMLTASKTNWLTTNDWLVTFTYDGANRVTNTTQGERVIAYRFNIPDRTRKITYPTGTNVTKMVVTESNDFRGRLLTVNDGGVTNIATHTYDPGNRVLTRTYGNNVVAQYAYNPNNWITSLLHTNPAAATSIAGFTYAYDREGNKLYEENLWNTNRSEAYAYDPIYRLTNWLAGRLIGDTVSAPTNSQQWQLDCLGNWITTTTNGVPEFRSHSPANEISNIQIGAGPIVPIIHDDNGNLINDAKHAYGYDMESRLLQATRLAPLPGDPRVVGQYQYDALGRRVRKLASPLGVAAETRYFHDGARIIEEQDAAMNTLATYTYGNYIDEILTMNRAGQTFYYHQNSLWSVEAVTDAAANTVERYAYDAYGLPTVANGAGGPVASNSWGTAHSAIGNPWMFTGRQFDEETGLYYYRARYYDPVNGRFVQRDALGYVDDVNLYQYVRGNPIRNVDPHGLSACEPKLVNESGGPLPYDKHKEFGLDWLLGNNYFDWYGNMSVIASDTSVSAFALSRATVIWWYSFLYSNFRSVSQATGKVWCDCVEDESSKGIKCIARASGGGDSDTDTVVGSGALVSAQTADDTAKLSVTVGVSLDAQAAVANVTVGAEREVPGGKITAGATFQISGNKVAKTVTREYSYKCILKQ